MKLSTKELIKLLLTRERLTQKKLAELLTERTSKKYTPDGLSRKLSKGTFSYDEVVLIADILGYDIVAQHREDK